VNSKKTKILSKIKEYVNGVDTCAEVILFGSQARDEERKDSDWDILILVPSQVNLKDEQKFRHKLFELELEYNLPFSTYVYSKSEWKNKYYVTPFFHNVQQDGILL